ncbi:phage baseplate assembly protein V [Chryseobacterium oryctis]|uniref:Phage baseplate assembly protein V n=1 Tax=Chryseobacterium oryctis TaxID=2952618 RepID=A0ABT3HRP6_9FLAO|nr:phage baseplate assembly protein V [Chryseobacterium oryctis]MCW3162453.1 phage baseplate assembly protein V [Chryseobacterium oryctis]
MKPFYPDETLLKLEFLINNENQGLDNLLSEGKVHFEVNKIPFAKFTFICSDEDFKEGNNSPLQSLNRPQGASPLPIEVKISYKKEMKTIFKGVIKSLDLHHENCNVVAKIECKDIALNLLQSSTDEQNDSETFEDKLTSFISNLTLSSDLSGQSWGQEHVTHNRSTVPWDYIVGFLDSIGLPVVLRNAEFTCVDIINGEKEVKYNAENGINVFAFNGRIDPDVIKSSVTIQHWDIESQSVSEITSENEAEENPHTLRISETNLQPETLQKVADAIIAKSRIASISGKVATFGNLEAKIGEYITFNKVNSEIDGKELLITTEEHIIENGCWKTEFTYGLENERSFTQNTTSGINNANAELGHSNSVNGLQIGIVTQIVEDPNNQFRIKVRIPVLSENGEGVWARLATLNAANEMGSYFIPNINDEVIVGCIGNNPDTPVILGSLYSSNRAMPFPIAEENYKRGFVTKEGTKIIMDDEKKSIEISTAKGNKITISDDLKGITMQDENNNKIVMDDQGITIESYKDLNLKATGNVKIEGVQIAGNASGNMDLKGAMINLN